MRGCTIRRTSAPHSLWHFDKVLARARSLDDNATERFHSLIARNGGEQVMEIHLSRPLERRDYVLVLGDS